MLGFLMRLRSHDRAMVGSSGLDTAPKALSVVKRSMPGRAHPRQIESEVVGTALCSDETDISCDVSRPDNVREADTVEPCSEPASVHRLEAERKDPFNNGDLPARKDPFNNGDPPHNEGLEGVLAAKLPVDMEALSSMDVAVKTLRGVLCDVGVAPPKTKSCSETFVAPWLELREEFPINNGLESAGMLLLGWPGAAEGWVFKLETLSGEAKGEGAEGLAPEFPVGTEPVTCSGAVKMLPALVDLDVGVAPTPEVVTSAALPAAELSKPKRNDPLNNGLEDRGLPLTEGLDNKGVLLHGDVANVAPDGLSVRLTVKLSRNDPRLLTGFALTGKLWACILA